MSKLKNFKVAVYGTLRRDDNIRGGVLKDADYLGTFNTEPVYTMRDNGGFPVLFPGGNTSVVIEVYEVKDNDTILGRLDAIESYHGENQDNLYDREIIVTPWGNAFIYLAGKRFRDVLKLNPKRLPVIECGDWIEHANDKKVRELVRK